MFLLQTQSSGMCIVFGSKPDLLQCIEVLNYSSLSIEQSIYFLT